MKTFLFVLLLFQVPVLCAQLNCKTVKQADGAEVKQCYHRNGKISIIETWDKDRRSGSLKGFNNKGDEVFFYNLRRIGGHASALLSWYPNGQVKSVNYSDAPDAGIQYYHSTRLFDEAGNQTSFTEDSYDDKPTVPEPVLKDTVRPRKPLVEINRVLEKPKSKQVDFRIMNKTRSRQQVALDYSTDTPDTILNIAGKQEVYQLISQSKSDQKLNNVPELKLVGKTKRFELIRGKEEELEDRLVITWYIINI